MQIEVRPAKPDERTIAWPLYKSFIEEHVYPKCSTDLSCSDWCGQEEALFSKRWDAAENYIIETDGKSVGWAGVRKSNNAMIIENVFVEEEWRSKGIVEKIFEEMIPVWKSEKRVVHVPVMGQDGRSDGIIKALEGVGFSMGEHDGIAQTMTANFSN